VEFIQSLLSLLVRNFLSNLDLVSMLVAYLLMSRLIKHEATRRGLDAHYVSDLSFWVAVAAVVGGRLAFAIPSFQSYLAYPVDLIRIDTGLYFYGAAAGGVALGAWYARRKRIRFWVVADLYGLYTPLAIALTRFGCLLENTCYGRRAAPPLGILFPGLTQHRYPSELYEGLMAFLLFGILFWLSQKRRTEGFLFLSFLIGYPIARTLTGLTRINLGGNIRMVDPVLSVGVAVCAMLLLWLMANPGKGTGHLTRGLRPTRR